LCDLSGKNLNIIKMKSYGAYWTLPKYAHDPRTGIGLTLGFPWDKIYAGRAGLRVKSEESKTRFQFTEACIRDLVLPSKRVRLYDTKTKGLCLRVTPEGVKTYGVYRWFEGRPTELSLGRSDAISLVQARRMAEVKIGKLADGEDIQAEKRAIRKETTLGELFDSYLELYAKPRKRSWREDEGLWNRYFQPLRNRRLSAITPGDVQSAHGKIGREHGQGAANRAHSLLRKMFNFARTRGWRGDNPAVGVLRFKERSRERFMDGEELRQFFAALQAEPDITARDFFLLALLTGARRSNVLAMRWEDIDLSRGLWRIPGEKSKNGEDLVVILAPQVVELLTPRKAMANGSPWVLPSGGSKSGHFVEPKCAWRRILARAELSRLLVLLAIAKGEGPAEVEAAMQEADKEIERIRFDAFARRMPKGTDPFAVVLERYRQDAISIKINPDEAKMRDLRIHDLRRTLGSWQAASGSSLSVIGRSLGHKQVQTTAIYARLGLGPVRESVERAASAMLTAGISQTKEIAP
jgi:integrase